MGTRFDGLLPPEVIVVEASPEMWETGLLPEEQGYVAGAVRKRVREFTAGRNSARQALARSGMPPCAITVAHGRAPVFPSGVSGTITHTDNYCAAAVVRVGRILSLGIDAESNEPLGSGLVNIIAVPAEREMLNRLTPRCGVSWERVLFSAKEAFYKAYFQLAGEYLDFLEVNVTVDPVGQSFSLHVLRQDVRRYFRENACVGAYRYDDRLICTAVALPSRAGDETLFKVADPRRAYFSAALGMVAARSSDRPRTDPGT